MSPDRPPRVSARIAGAVAVLALIAGVLVAVRQWQSVRAPRGRSPEPPLAAALSPQDSAAGEDAIALALAPLDSVAIKSRWIEELSGVDLAGLDDARREVFLRFANAGRCTCGCGYTLAGCRASDMECDVSGPRLVALLDSVRAGRITNAAGLRERPHR